MRYTYLTILLPTSHCLSKTNFLKETKNRIHMNPYISAKRRWQGDFFNFGCHIPSSSRVRPWPTSTLGTSSWRGTIDHPQCGTQVTTAFGQDLGVGDKQWWHWMKRKIFWHSWDLVYNFVFGTWIVGENDVAVSDEDLKSVDALNSAVKSGVLMSFFGFP